MAEGRDTGLPLEVAFHKCWHYESITGHWCSLANLLNHSVPTQEGQAACGHCKVEEYELLFSCRWPSNSSNDNNNWHRHRYALCLPLRALSTLLRALHLL